MEKSFNFLIKKIQNNIFLLNLLNICFIDCSEQDLFNSRNLSFNKINILTEKLKEKVIEADTSFGSYYGIMPRLIKKYNLKIGAEVGVYCGGNSFCILNNSNVEKLFIIDPYSYIDDNTSLLRNQDFLDMLYLFVKIRITEFGQRANLLRLTSVEAAKKFKNLSLDFVFLDANHMYEAVKEDLNIWFDKIRPGGLFAGDDYATTWPGVPQAVNEFCKEKNLKLIQDDAQPRIWYFIKP